MQTIVELPEYIRKSSTLLTENEKIAIINYLANHPRAGTLIKETGGIRKFRWGSGNRGKSGSVRIIYYYHNPTMPLFLLTLFKKNQKENLSKSERNELSKFTTFLINNYGANNV